MPALCPLCASDELTESHRLDDGTRYAVCLHASHGTDGYVWQPSEPGSKSLRADGLGYELGIWDKLLTCFTSGEDFVPYGTVEDRFIESYPAEGSTLLHRYGHRWRDPDHPATRYSMSVYLALRLRELEKEGLLDVEWGRAEASGRTTGSSANGVPDEWRCRLDHHGAHPVHVEVGANRGTKRAVGQMSQMDPMGTFRDSRSHPEQPFLQSTHNAGSMPAAVPRRCGVSDLQAPTQTLSSPSAN